MNPNIHPGYFLLWFISTLTFFFSPVNVNSQKNKNYIDIQISDDNSGEISNWFHTGDDQGESFSFRIEANITTIHPRYNFMIRWESTEFSVLDLRTTEPRDILFNELNNYKLTFDNNKLKERSCFYEISIGLFYIQSSRIFIGATGLKNFFHNEILKHVYPGRYWLYNPSNEPDHYFPFIDLNYGYTISFFQRPHFALQTISKGGLQLSDNINFSGIHAKTEISNRFLIGKKWLTEIDIELKGFYQTNFVGYQIANGVFGIRLSWKHIAIYTHLFKPFLKNLNNPFILYDDMELLFNFGFSVII